MSAIKLGIRNVAYIQKSVEVCTCHSSHVLRLLALPGTVERATQKPTPMVLYDNPSVTNKHRFIIYACMVTKEMSIKTSHEHLPLPCPDSTKKFCENFRTSRNKAHVNAFPYIATPFPPHPPKEYFSLLKQETNADGFGAGASFAGPEIDRSRFLQRTKEALRVNGKIKHLFDSFQDKLRKINIGRLKNTV